MNISLKWFKEAIKHSVDRVVEKRVNKAVEEMEGELVFTKPYKQVKMVNDVLTIVLPDGDVVSKPDATEADFNAVKLATSHDDILNILCSEETRKESRKVSDEAARVKNILAGFSVLEQTGDFVVDGSSVYLKGINRTLPQLLVEKFVAIIGQYSEHYEPQQINELLLSDDEYIGLKRFFMWACLNPRAEVADKLYDFLEQNGMQITKQGFFVALRNVVTVHGGVDFVHFVSNAYNKVKAVWKKSPDNYVVFLENGEYKLVHTNDLTTTETVKSTTCPDCGGDGGWYDEEDESDFDENWNDCDTCNGTGEVEEYEYTVIVPVNHGERIGGLTDLYLDLPNRYENRFTDDWTKTFDIRIGRVVNMPIEDCNWSTQDCATAGLHFAGYTAPYVLCGNTTVFTLHNPMKVVGIGTEKGRCWEYLPFMTTTVQEADEIMNDGSFDFLQLDEQYAIRELEDLVAKIQDGIQAEVKKYEFNLPKISAEEIHNIVKSLDEMKGEILNRVYNID